MNAVKTWFSFPFLLLLLLLQVNCTFPPEFGEEKQSLSGTWYMAQETETGVKPDFPGEAWTVVELPSNGLYSLLAQPRGVTWFQRTVELDNDSVAFFRQPLSLVSQSMIGADQVYLNGVRLTKDEHYTEDVDNAGFTFTNAPLSGFRIEQDYLK